MRVSNSAWLSSPDSTRRFQLAMTASLTVMRVAANGHMALAVMP